MISNSVTEQVHVLAFREGSVSPTSWYLQHLTEILLHNFATIVSLVNTYYGKKT